MKGHNRSSGLDMMFVSSISNEGSEVMGVIIGRGRRGKMRHKNEMSVHGKVLLMFVQWA